MFNKQTHLFIRVRSKHCQRLVQVLLVVFSKVWRALVSKVEEEIVATVRSGYLRLQKLIQGCGKRHGWLSRGWFLGD